MTGTDLCSCGYGGYHEELNPNCDLNRPGMTDHPFHDSAVGTVEGLTDQDFADLPADLQASLLDWWTRFYAWREQQEIVIEADPYDRPVQVQGHTHSEPICCYPDCSTYLTRDQMAALQREALTAIRGYRSGQ